MNVDTAGLDSRRKFLQMIAASPLFAGANLVGAPLKQFLLTELGFSPEIAEAFAAQQQTDNVITSIDQALNVMDFEPAARKALPPAHYGYLAGGVDDDATVRANHDAYSHIQIRARRLADVEKIDTSVNLFGTAWSSPIIICPVGSQKAFHLEGEVATARAAKAKDHVQILSTLSTCSIEEVTEARGAPVWQQLYPTNDWQVTKAIITRAERASSPAIVYTVDLQEGSNRETLFRFQQIDKRDCTGCHQSSYSPFARGKPGVNSGNFASFVAPYPAFNGLDLSKATGLRASPMNWDFVKRLRDTVSVKLLLKGIVSKEDAKIAVEHGVDGLIVSNHGGRAEETLRPTIESLPEVLEGVAGKLPVIVDGGIRRGTDIFKALALGATAVGVGRPPVWGLAAFGQAGVETVLEMLRRELRTIMRQAGTASISNITRNYVVPR